MATNTVQPGTVPASPSRRAAIGILAASPVALLPALHSPAQAAPVAAAGQSPAMRGLMDDYRALDRDCDYWLKTAYDPAWRKAHDDIAAIPHHRTAHSFRNFEGGLTSLTTEDPSSVATARRVMDDDKGDWLSFDQDYVDTITELAKAADKRDQRKKEIRKVYNIDALVEQEDARGEALGKAIDRILEAEAQTVGDLAAKLEIVVETDCWLHGGFQEAVTADIRRLAGIA